LKVFDYRKELKNLVTIFTKEISGASKNILKLGYDFSERQIGKNEQLKAKRPPLSVLLQGAADAI
jgi:hypothetical protein